MRIGSSTRRFASRCVQNAQPSQTRAAQKSRLSTVRVNAVEWKTVESDPTMTSLLAADGDRETRAVPIVSESHAEPFVNGPVTVVYRAYEDGVLVATGRLTVDDVPGVG